MTKADAWKNRKCVCDYWLFADQLRIACKDFKLKDSYSVRFYFAPPKSYGNKKRDDIIGMPHRLKPDIDNLIKSIQDILRKGDDQEIFSVNSMKVWGESDCIVIENRI